MPHLALCVSLPLPVNPLRKMSEFCELLLRIGWTPARRCGNLRPVQLKHRQPAAQETGTRSGWGSPQDWALNLQVDPGLNCKGARLEQESRLAWESPSVESGVGIVNAV